ncbi:hypothetical protein HanPI659440_Chr00c08g0720031 [Helianthus annuus]|nr:hypothetical protein HanPI659440_Chr00c08g0720031 [Helianthus annuus]
MPWCTFCFIKPSYLVDKCGFCIVPLGKALFTMVSESVNLAARRTIEVLERPDQLSSRSLQKVDDLNNQLHQVMLSMKNMQSNHFKVNQVSYQRP